MAACGSVSLDECTPKYVSRGDLDAVGVLAEERDVEVVVQDRGLGLVPQALDVERAARVLHLAAHVLRDGGGLLLLVVARLVVADLLDVLHCQRRAALRVTAGRAHRRAQQPAQVDAVMAVEAAVLGGDERVLQVLRHLAQRHRHAVLGEDARQRRSCCRARRASWAAAACVSGRLHVVFWNCVRSAWPPARCPARTAAPPLQPARRWRPAPATACRSSASGWVDGRQLPRGIRVRAGRCGVRSLRPGSGWAPGAQRAHAGALRRRAGRRWCAGRPGRARRRAAPAR